MTGKLLIGAFATISNGGRKKLWAAIGRGAETAPLGTNCHPLV